MNALEQASQPATQADDENAALTAFCPTYARATDVLGRRWMGLILRVLLTGPHRFNEILAAIPGLSDPLLTQRLRELEAERLVERHVLPTSPVRVEYSLTEAGRDLERVVRAIGAWAHRWLA
jgi:DNA-binding HxlR family transcriptional regulator